MTRIGQIYTDFLSVVIRNIRACPAFLGVTCPTTGGSVFFIRMDTDDTDWTDLHGFFISGHPQHPRHPRSVFMGTRFFICGYPFYRCHLSDHRRIRVLFLSGTKIVSHPRPSA
ncbi:MAG: hypothetical protein RBT65_17130 [Methanolobus sp.]|nr:hypothetical protein [Methanolobus sp.]